MAVSNLAMYWCIALVIWLFSISSGEAKIYAETVFTDSSKTLEQPSSLVFSTLEQKYQDESAVLQQFAQANVVYLGEVHDRLEDHQVQLQIIRALHQQHPKMAIAMEMFQRPAQPLLNQYLEGQISETDLVARSQYEQRWGYAWEFYAPILRFAKQHRLPVIALNTPTEVTRKVARQGLEGLSVAERQWIPPQSAIVLGPQSSAQRMQKIYAESHQGKGQSGGFERFFLAQVLWDETMAERIAAWVQENPDGLVVVLAGQGHIAYGEGIPNRVERRLQGLKDFAQFSVLLNATENKTERAIADYLWIKPRE
jgi:uncharacterized iron-regulated protein